MVPRVSQCNPWYIINGLAPRWRWDIKLTYSYFPYPAVPLFLTFTGPQHDQLFSLPVAAVTDQDDANKEKNKTKRIHAWDKWCTSLWSIGFRSDVFLEGLSHCQRKIVLVDFAQAVRQAGFLQRPKKRLIAAKVRYTIGYLSQIFKAALIDKLRREPYG